MAGSDERKDDMNIYYIWSGPNAGWLRHARDLIKWEIGNFFAAEVRVRPEPRPDGWPCNAPLNRPGDAAQEKRTSQSSFVISYLMLS
jgi:hypothetical protein